MDSEEVDPVLLQYETVTNRKKYFQAIQYLLDKQIKYRMQILESISVQVEMPKIPEISVVPIVACENDVLDKKYHKDFINKLKEHTHVLEILNKTKDCPISQLMDKL